MTCLDSDKISTPTRPGFPFRFCWKLVSKIRWIQLKCEGEVDWNRVSYRRDCGSGGMKVISAGRQLSTREDGTTMDWLPSRIDLSLSLLHTIWCAVLHFFTCPEALYSPGSSKSMLVKKVKDITNIRWQSRRITKINTLTSLWRLDCATRNNVVGNTRVFEYIARIIVIRQVNCWSVCFEKNIHEINFIFKGKILEVL